MPGGPESSAEQLDAFARSKGYQNYTQMHAFFQQRSAALRRNTTTEQAAPPQPAPPVVDQRSWYQRLFDAMGGK